MMKKSLNTYKNNIHYLKLSYDEDIAVRTTLCFHQCHFWCDTEFTAQGYDYYNKDFNGFTIKEMLDAAINKFLKYPKKYLASAKDSYAIDCPTKGQNLYIYEQIDFFQTSLYGFVSLFENNVNNAQEIDFSNIQKLQIIWDEKKSDGKKYIYEDYNENGKTDIVIFPTM